MSATSYPDPMPYPFSEPRGLELDPTYAELRASGELARVQLPYGAPTWLATRYEDVKTVLGDPRFSREQALGEDEPRILSYVHRPDTILTMDPPGHTRLRRAVSKAFTVRRIEALRPATQEIVDGLLDTVEKDGPPADLMRSFALALPMMVICDLLGCPFEDRHKFHHWSEILASTAASEYTPEQLRQANDDLRAYIADQVAQREQQPADDLLSVLLEKDDIPDPLTRDEIVGLGWSVLLAGFEITANAIVNSTFTLLTSPEHLDQLRRQPELVPHAVEELLRYVPLTVGSFFPRRALEDVQLGKTQVCAGDTVLPATFSANRDESVFPNAEQLDFTREDNPHLTFSHGIHHCLGAQLARMELQVVIGSLLERYPDLRLAVPVEEVPWRQGSILRGPAELRVVW